MARLIDLVEREAVKNAIGFMNLHFLGHGENKSLLDSINEVPSVDAVPVVRCKDCRFRKSTFNGDGYYCSVWDTDDYEEAYVKDSDFCSYGERKDNG